MTVACTTDALHSVRLRLNSALSIAIEGASETVHPLIGPLGELLRAAPTMTDLGRVQIVPTALSAPARFPAEPSAYGVATWRDSGAVALEMQRAAADLRWNADGTAAVELRIAPGDTLALHRALALLSAVAFPRHRAVVVHASACVSRGRALVFLGESGAGKSTTARRLAAEGAQQIADDMLIVRAERDGVWAEPFFADAAFEPLAARSTEIAWPVANVLSVDKGAARTELKEPLADPVAAWLAAIFTPGVPLGRAPALLDLVETLAQRCRPRRVEVAAGGGLLAELESAFGEPDEHR